MTSLTIASRHAPVTVYKQTNWLRQP